MVIMKDSEKGSEGRRVLNAMTLATKIVPPVGVPTYVVLTYDAYDCPKSSDKEKVTYTLTDLKDLEGSHQVADVAGADVQALIAEKFSARMATRHQKPLKYSLLSVQEAYDLLCTDSDEGRNFANYVLRRNFIWNRERFRAPNLIFPNPVTTTKAGKITFSGHSIEAEIYNDDIVSTLAIAGLLKGPATEIERSGWIHLDEENGEAAALSDLTYDKETKQHSFATEAEPPYFPAPAAALVMTKIDDRINAAS
jgi:hypothetical protein